MEAKQTQELITFVKEWRKRTGLSQVDLARKAGVGLRFVRDLEQGKQTLQIEKVNQVLSLFGAKLGPIINSPLKDNHE